MNELRNDKGSSFSVIAAYRKRQERAVRMLVASWIGVMVFVIGAGYLIYRFLIPGNAQLTQEITEMPAAAESTALNTVTFSPTAVVAADIPEQTETPVPSATLAGPRIVSYTVKQGDTLFSIAVQFGIGLVEITALNPLVTPEFLSIGDQLTIPARGDSLPSATPDSTGLQGLLDYKVVAGDTLAAIAARFGSTVDAIVRENNLDSPDQILVGQSLRIPVEAGVPTTPAPATVNPELRLTATPTQ